MTHRSKPIRTSRLSRMSLMGRLAGGVASSILAEGARRWQRGEAWNLKEQALTPANLKRVSTQLSEMRGAAMKLGQLISMDAGHLIPPELNQLLSQLRKDAHTLPLAQLEPILINCWGKEWPQLFQRFSYTPLASASIGQVHTAVTQDGQSLAIKVQYPGVAKSIASDLNNVATLLRWSRLLPADLDISPLVAEAREQLVLETDYQQEARHLETFRALLAQDKNLVVPKLNKHLSHANLLVMSFLPGHPIETLETASQAERNHWVRILFKLFFRELFEFRWVQTDPNYANFLIDRDNQQLGLIDFGAVRPYPLATSEAYRDLMRGMALNSEASMSSAARQLGYFSPNINSQQQATLIRMMKIASEPLRCSGTYNFAESNLVERLSDLGFKLSFDHNYWHLPPVEALLLHRKLAGLFLLAQRLKAQIAVAELAEPYLARPDHILPIRPASVP